MARETNRREFVQVSRTGGVGIDGGCPSAGRGRSGSRRRARRREQWAHAFAH